MLDDFDQRARVVGIVSQPGFAKIAGRVDLHTEAPARVLARVDRTLDAFHLPSTRAGELEQVSHGAADIEQASGLDAAADVRHGLVVQVRYAGIQFAVLLDGGKVGALEVVVRFAGELPRVDEDQAANITLDDAVVPFAAHFRLLFGAA
jgi:hypothetical protein